MIVNYKPEFHERRFIEKNSRWQKIQKEEYLGTTPTRIVIKFRKSDGKDWKTYQAGTLQKVKHTQLN